MQPEQEWEERNSIVIHRTWMNSHSSWLNQAELRTLRSYRVRGGKGRAFCGGQGKTQYIYIYIYMAGLHTPFHLSLLLFLNKPGNRDYILLARKWRKSDTFTRLSS